MRRKIEKENPEQLKIKMWLFPYLTYFTILVICAILASMLFIESMRPQLILTSIITIGVLAAYFIFKPNKKCLQVQRLKINTLNSPAEKRVFILFTYLDVRTYNVSN